MNTADPLDALRDVVHHAGQTVLAMSRDGFEVARKANQDPVTTADLEADRILKEALLTSTPDAGWLSEETRDDPARLTCDRVWVVDPIDGTKEFVTGIAEFAVSVALVEASRPVQAAVYNPATEEMFLAARGRGATLNGQAIGGDRPTPERPVLLASRSEIKRGEWKAFETCAEVRPCGSIAYKLALVAAGRADATFSLGPKNEWDIAAGVLLVEEVGGCAGDKKRRTFPFNQADTLVDGIVAATAAFGGGVYELIERTIGETAG